jgi:hypothetical protein
MKNFEVFLTLLILQIAACLSRLGVAKKQENRDFVVGQIGDVVACLRLVDGRLGDLAESLPLPEDADQMWEQEIPMSFNANLYASIGAVRSDCLQSAMATLQRAMHENDASLRTLCANVSETSGRERS